MKLTAKMILPIKSFGLRAANGVCISTSAYWDGM